MTSRLYSTRPEPTVGMFIPGLPDNEAHAANGPDVDPQRRPKRVPHQRGRVQPGGRFGHGDLHDFRRRRPGRHASFDLDLRALGRPGQQHLQGGGPGGPRHRERRDRRLGGSRDLLVRRRHRQQHDRSRSSSAAPRTWPLRGPRRTGRCRSARTASCSRTMRATAA